MKYGQRCEHQQGWCLSRDQHRQKTHQLLTSTCWAIEERLPQSWHSEDGSHCQNCRRQGASRRKIRTSVSSSLLLISSQSFPLARANWESRENVGWMVQPARKVGFKTQRRGKEGQGMGLGAGSNTDTIT